MNIRNGIRGLLALGGLFFLGWLWVVDDRSPTIFITAEEFRLTPDTTTLPAFQETRVVIRNQGKERHRIDGTLLKRHAVVLTGESTIGRDTNGNYVNLEPGQSVMVQVTLPQGMYTVRCLIQGHGGMEGVVLVTEEKKS
ncbi:MAG: hypothetical protein MRJ96_11015 [Nitrospirales bacterium]|nr:hypothetical protein [Nitrospira sp.]MDR4501970.1 hypothetical protein [Nitrospirales bacterium]